MGPDLDAGASGQSHSVLQPQRPLDPRSSVEDYNRVMRDYTQRRMSSFGEKDDHTSNGRGLSTSIRYSRLSESSGNSTRSNNTNDFSPATSSPSTTTSGLMARQQHPLQGGKTTVSGPEEQVVQN